MAPISAAPKDSAIIGPAEPAAALLAPAAPAEAVWETADDDDDERDAVEDAPVRMLVGPV